jgi:hypothetical protein
MIFRVHITDDILRDLPPRFQVRRTKGWRKPEGGIVVARPSRWGNGYRFPYQPYGQVMAVLLFAYKCLSFGPLSQYVEEIQGKLRGHPLGCYCPLDQACHADVLRVLANLGPKALAEWLAGGLRL